MVVAGLVLLLLSVVGLVVNNRMIASEQAKTRAAYARDWDLDSVACPVVTFLGDVVTLPSLFAASYLARARHSELLHHSASSEPSTASR